MWPQRSIRGESIASVCSLLSFVKPSLRPLHIGSVYGDLSGLIALRILYHSNQFIDSARGKLCAIAAPCEVNHTPMRMGVATPCVAVIASLIRPRFPIRCRNSYQHAGSVIVGASVVVADVAFQANEQSAYLALQLSFVFSCLHWLPFNYCFLLSALDCASYVML